MAEIESFFQFAYLILYFDWNELEGEEGDIVPVIINLFILSTVRCLLLALLFYYGSTFLHLISKTRNLSPNYYVPSKINVLEYLILHAFGQLLSSTLQLETFQVCSIVVVSAIANFYMCELFFWSKKRHCKTNVN